MVDSNNIRRYLDNLNDERNSAFLYRALGELEIDPRIAEVYKRLAITEDKHAARWESQLKELGHTLPAFHPAWRTRLLIWLARHFGIDFVLPTLSSIETITSHDYATQPEATDMIASEQSHAHLLQQINHSQSGEGITGPILAKLEGRHRSAGGNALRAAVLGASDGLLSNFSLIMGVAGATVTSQNILLTGLAGLLAGAISMALGEWISVQSSRELYERQIATEREEIAANPEEELEELVLIYQARGMSEPLARDLAVSLISNPATALDALVRDELGIDPDELGGSAWEAAITSFLLFAAGAILPVIPFLFWQNHQATILSAILSAGGLFLIGAVTTLFTGRSILYSGCRQVFFGLASAAITYLIGHIIGITVL